MQATNAADEGTTAVPSLSSIHNQLLKKASIMPQQPSLPILRESDIVVGRRLGEGGFCQVFDLAKIETRRLSDGSITTLSTVTADSSEDTVTKSRFKRASTEATKAGSSILNKIIYNVALGQYVVKRPKENLPNELEKYKAIIDIQIEGRVLMKLSHRNIITLRCLSEGIDDKLPNWKTYYREKQKGDREKLNLNRYFLVMDRLPEILTRRLSFWERKMKKYSINKSTEPCQFFMPFCRSSTKTSEDIRTDQRARLDLERIYASLNIARAIQYLHEQQ